MSVSLHLLKKGARLKNRYTIEDVIGEGGYGITYVGQDEILDQIVAIKEYFPHGIVSRNTNYGSELTISQLNYGENYEKGKVRFLAEAQTLAKFNSQSGIVHVRDYFESNNTAYIVMEYLAGVSLKDYLKQNGVLAVDEVLDMMAPLFEALDAVHQSGMIHRDISPDNIMVLTDGHLCLVDFGAAKDYTEFGEKSFSIILKYSYAPEEQYRAHGVQGPWTDIYAIAATIYRCITGIVPVESIERLLSDEDSLKTPSELGVKIDKKTEQVLMKGLSIHAKDRYQNLKEFCQDLYDVNRNHSGRRDTPPTDSKKTADTDLKMALDEDSVQRSDPDLVKETEGKVEEKSSDSMTKHLGFLWKGILFAVVFVTILFSVKTYRALVRKEQQEKLEKQYSSYIEEGKILEESGRYEEAEDRFKDAMNQDSSKTEAYEELKNLYISTGQYDEADDFLEKNKDGAISGKAEMWQEQVDTARLDAYNNAMNAARVTVSEKKSISEIQTAYENAMSIDKTKTEALHEMASMYIDRKKYADGTSWFDSVIGNTSEYDENVIEGAREEKNRVILTKVYRLVNHKNYTELAKFYNDEKYNLEQVEGQNAGNLYYYKDGNPVTSIESGWGMILNTYSGVYVGEIKNSERSGYGKYVVTWTSSGKIENGNWKEDKASGKIKISTLNKSGDQLKVDRRYEGTAKSSKFEGSFSEEIKCDDGKRRTFYGTANSHVPKVIRKSDEGYYIFAETKSGNWYVYYREKSDLKNCLPSID